MKLDDALQTIVHFFNDTIGSVIPGLVLGTGLVVIHKGMPTSLDIKNIDSNGAFIALILALTFAVGHGLLAVFSDIFRKVLECFCILKGDSLLNQPETRKSYVLFKDLVNEKVNQHLLNMATHSNLEWHFNDLRSIALSISKEAGDLGRRFMFISLFCNGIGTAIFLLAFDFFLCAIWFPNALVQYSDSLNSVLQFVMLIVLGVLCFRRGEEFYKRAMFTPFSVATTELLMKDANNGKSTL